MRILFSRNELQSKASGFDMGNITIESGDVKISSQGNSKCLMMIYIAITDLIFGVLELKPKGGTYEFIGADSSFSLSFKFHEKFVEISQKKGVSIECATRDFFDSIFFGVKDFLASGNELPISDSVASDLSLALEKLEVKINR